MLIIVISSSPDPSDSTRFTRFVRHWLWKCPRAEQRWQITFLALHSCNGWLCLEPQRWQAFLFWLAGFAFLSSRAWNGFLLIGLGFGRFPLAFAFIASTLALSLLFCMISSCCLVSSAAFTCATTWFRVFESSAISRRRSLESRKPAIICVCSMSSRKSPNLQRSARRCRSSVKDITGSFSPCMRLTNCVRSNTKTILPLKCSLNFFRTLS